jgi:hypothetical protein
LELQLHPHRPLDVVCHVIMSCGQASELPDFRMTRSTTRSRGLFASWRRERR